MADEYVAQDETYVSTYDVYRRGLLDQQRVWVSKQVVPILTARLNQPCYRVLAVGSGEGDVDMLLLETLVEEMQRNGKSCEIHYNIIERNPNFVERFKNRVKKSSLEKIKFSWHLGTFEEVVSKNADSLGTFNLIHLFHSLYYMAEESVLQECMSKYLAPGGCLLSVVQTEGSVYTRSCRKYEGNLDKCFDGFHVLSDENLQLIASKNAWECKVEIGKRVLDLTSMLGGKNPTPQGSKLFDFFFHANDLIENLKEEKLREILDFLKSMCTVEDGKFMAEGSEGIVFYFKGL